MGLLSRLPVQNRIESIDFWRGLAVLAVVLYHFDGVLPMGEIGVDLFFVISGLLVSKSLLFKLDQNKSVKFFKFFFKRGFKIWPSYLVFLFVGILIATVSFSQENQKLIIPFSELPKYIFFYRNYTGGHYYWPFEHIWSLCVEEHFYVILPILFIIVSIFKKKRKMLFISLLFLILFGWVVKFLVFYYTNSQDTYAATHNRVDALALGVLMNLFLDHKHCSKLIKSKSIWLLTIGLLIIITSVFLNLTLEGVFFDKVLFHSLIPLGFFCSLLGTYYMAFRYTQPIKYLGYHSYNWYLWHPIFSIVIQQYFTLNFLSISLYILFSLLFSILITKIVEEPFLKLRNRIIK